MLRAGALAACCFCVMSRGGDSEEQRHPGPSRVVDSNQLERRSLGKNDAGDEIDERLLIDPKMLYVGKKIGEGAHGRVYEGKYSGQIVAIKVLSGGSTVEEKATLGTRFVREVNLMSRVKHENLVEFVGACRSPFMVVVTELLPGMSLKKYLRSIRPKQLDLHVAVGFALDIAHAVDCLHANGIIHRDLKPDNLLLTANEKSLKLADFGLAREESVTEMMTASTGTYRWMAPELYSTVTLRQGEKKHYTNKVDVYSFGFVLWELLTNRMPFEGMSNLQAAYAAAFKQARPPISDEIPGELAFIVRSCWVEDPSLRPSFSQIICLLNSFLSTLHPPTPQSDAVPPVMSSGRGTMTNASSFRMGWKLSCLRQLFAAKRTGNSR